MTDIYSFFDWANKTSQYVAEKLPECDELFFHCGFFWRDATWLSPTFCRCYVEFHVQDTPFLHAVVLPELKHLLSSATDKMRSGLVNLDDTPIVCLEWSEVPINIVRRLSRDCFGSSGWIVPPGEHPFHARREDR